VRELKKKLSKMFYEALREEVGVKYTDWGKLMRIAEKFAKYGKHLIEKEGWTEKHVLFFGALCIYYYLIERNNPKPEAIFGQPEENRAILKLLREKKRSKYEALRSKAEALIENYQEVGA